MTGLRLYSGAVGLAGATDAAVKKMLSRKSIFCPKIVVSKNHFRLFCKNIVGGTHLILDEIQLYEGNWQRELKKYHS